MTTVQATLQNFRQSPRKVRLVVDLLRGQTVAAAVARLQHQPQKSAEPLIKLIKSAVASATHNYGLSEASLKVSAVTVDMAATYKRIIPAARGSAHPIRRVGSTICITLASPEEATLRAVGTPAAAVSAPVADDAPVAAA
jgi:large subunit ribosomal protein L22